MLTDLVLDLNGTLAYDGRLLPGVAARIARLVRSPDVLLVSRDTFGTAELAARELGVPLERLQPNEQAVQKPQIVRGRGLGTVAMVGNGRNSRLALAEVALGICVVGPEGAAT